MSQVPDPESTLSSPFGPTQFGGSQSSVPQPAYQPPRVQDLGAWQAVTLTSTIPFNPGSVSGPGGMFGPNGEQNHGTF